jgi:hypothetical protein
MTQETAGQSILSINLSLPLNIRRQKNSRQFYWDLKGPSVDKAKPLAW